MNPRLRPWRSEVIPRRRAAVAEGLPAAGIGPPLEDCRPFACLIGRVHFRSSRFEGDHALADGLGGVPQGLADIFGLERRVFP